MEYFYIKEKQTIHLPKKAEHKIIAEILNNYTAGVPWNVVYDAAENTIIVGNGKADLSCDKDYLVNVTIDGVAICGRSHAGVMRGFVTFLEEIGCFDRHVYRVKCGLIEGEPVIDFRSVHICVFPETSLQFLRKTIRCCAIAKYSHIIIEFWGTLKYDCLDVLGWSDAYTKQQIKDVLSEAKAFGIEIVPFFNHLGHASGSRGRIGKHVVLDQNLEYEYLFMPKSYGWIWDYTKPSVLELLRKVRDELIELCGEGSYFHLGCDEALMLGYGDNTAKEVAEYINSVAAELEEKGRRAIVWGDMFLSADFFPDVKANPELAKIAHYETNSTAEIATMFIETLNKNIIIADWQYNVFGEKWRSATLFKEKGFEVICSPYNRRDNVKTAIETVIEDEHYGFMKTTWHTLASNEFAVMVQAGLWAYEGEMDASYKVFSNMSDRTKTIMRKVQFPNGDRLTSGWKQEQIEI